MATGMVIAELHIGIGWFAMLLGALSGAVFGLFFHEEGWAGGYASFRRHMLRLGHICSCGVGRAGQRNNPGVLSSPGRPYQGSG